MQSNFDGRFLSDKGLSIHSVMNLTDLPESMLTNISQFCEDVSEFSQVIVIGHLGKALWEQLNVNAIDTAHPIDDFSVQSVEAYFQEKLSSHRYQIIYPSDDAIGLQQLGALAGWHYESPFRVGINSEWGSWFAYRVVVLADTHFTVTNILDAHSPCINCIDQACIKACPPNALATGRLDFQMCIDYRKIDASSCKNTCLARVGCPVATQYKYTNEQINYHYSVSMKTIDESY